MLALSPNQKTWTVRSVKNQAVASKEAVSFTTDQVNCMLDPNYHFSSVSKENKEDRVVLSVSPTKPIVQTQGEAL